MHVFTWIDGRQYDLLPEEARDLEREGVVEIDTSRPEPRQLDGDRIYFLTDNYLTEIGAHRDNDINYVVAFEKFNNDVMNLGYRVRSGRTRPTRLA